VALLTGSEGTLGIVTEASLRLLRRPEAVSTLLAAFATPDEASRAVAAIIAGGVVPAALEMMDAVVVEALQAAFGFRYPEGAGALLLLEVDGPLAGHAEETGTLADACRGAGALSVRVARDEAERAELWIVRKRAFGALGRIARNYYTQDGVIPRTRLPEMLARVARIAAEHRVRIANDPGVVALAELVVEGGVRHRIDQPRQQLPIVCDDVAVMQSHGLGHVAGLHVAEAVPDVAAFAGRFGRQIVLRQPGIDGAQARAVVPKHGAVLRQYGEVRQRMSVLGLIGPVQAHHDLREIGHFAQFVDDALHRRGAELRIQARQHQGHRPLTGELFEFPVQFRHRPSRKIVQRGDDAILKEVAHGGSSVGFGRWSFRNARGLW
jgi:hypothetical protein